MVPRWRSGECRVALYIEAETEENGDLNKWAHENGTLQKASGLFACYNGIVPITTDLRRKLARNRFM